MVAKFACAGVDVGGADCVVCGCCGFVVDDIVGEGCEAVVCGTGGASAVVEVVVGGDCGCASNLAFCSLRKFKPNDNKVNNIIILYYYNINTSIKILWGIK